jgi:hypothetical protein
LGGRIASVNFLNVLGAASVRQTEMHTAEPLVPGPSTYQVEVVFGKLKIYKSPGVDQYPADLFEAGGKTLHYEIRRLIKLI